MSVHKCQYINVVLERKDKKRKKSLLLFSRYSCFTRICQGIAVSPGFASYISIAEEQFVRAAEPFSTNCTDQEILPAWDAM